MHVHAHTSTLSRFTATATATAAAATAAPVAASSAATPVASTTDTQDTPAPRTDKGHRAHGGHGHLRQALGDALSDLGLALPTGGGKGDHGDGDGTSASSTGQTRHDLARFMHALFQAVKAEPAAATPAGTGADPKQGFAAGLSALIGEAGNGSAPASLQQAFDQLMSDLTGAKPVSASPAPVPAPAVPAEPQATTTADTAPTTDVATSEATTEPAATPTGDSTPAAPAPAPTEPAIEAQPAAVTLQSLLSRLQQNLGVYGARHRTPDSSAVGNTLNVTA